jgi:L-alanine-DL-glutamate epimerase-like enolase superfamily enzyme
MQIHTIARVTATPLNVPMHVTLAGADRKASLACVHVEVETAQGLVGHGFTAITEEDVIAQIVNGVAGPAIIGDDALAHEAIWEKLYWKTMPRGQTGYAAHAVAAIDLALWDIKGRRWASRCGGSSAARKRSDNRRRVRLFRPRAVGRRRELGWRKAGG